MAVLLLLLFVVVDVPRGPLVSVVSLEDLEDVMRKSVKWDCFSLYVLVCVGVGAGLVPRRFSSGTFGCVRFARA